jgi:hypothetical protein
LGLYIELRQSGERGAPIQVATVDVTEAEATKIKQLRLEGMKIAVAPVDALTYDPWGTKQYSPTSANGRVVQAHARASSTVGSIVDG